MRNYFEEMNIDYDELKSYEAIETYYDEVKDYSNLIQELQCDRVEALKQIVNKNKEIERLNNIINKTSKKLEATLNCIKDYMIENEEYIKIHTDYIYALEEQIEKLKGVDKE